MTGFIGSRKRTATIVAAVGAAFLIAGISFAAVRAETGSELAKAIFDLKIVGNPQTRICQGADGSYEMTTATYAGPLRGIAGLPSGQLTFGLTLVMSLNKKLGYVTGTWTLGDAGGNPQWRGRLMADVPNGADLDGFISGTLSDGTRALYGALYAVIAEDRRAVIGRIGDLTPPNRAVIVPTAPC